jgi:hypothetical protein
MHQVKAALLLLQLSMVVGAPGLSALVRAARARSRGLARILLLQMAALLAQDPRCPTVRCPRAHKVDTADLLA